MRVAFDQLSFLVVEDSPPMRRILRTMIEAFGAARVVEAADGIAGLAAFREASPDIVITDWEMPRLDGLGLVVALRDPALNPNPFVPVIMVSAYAEASRVVAAREAGVSEYLAKPVTPRALYDRVLSVVAEPRSFRRVEGRLVPERRGQEGGRP
ncbi:MAG TPA: response regulator [Beijerinckiaceae bacterium]